MHTYKNIYIYKIKYIYNKKIFFDKACVLILIAQYAFTSQNYTLAQRSLDELQAVYFSSSSIQPSQAYNKFPISNRHLYLHFSLLYITYHMHTGNMKLAAERLSEVHHILDSNLNDVNVDGSTGETTVNIFSYKMFFLGDSFILNKC